MKRISLSNFICIALLLFAADSECYSQTIHSVHDGNWEDSATWSIGSGLPDTIAVDTIIISNSVNYNADLLISNCYLLLDTGGSLCGHYKFHVFQCEVRQFGGSIYTDHGYEESSHWLCTDGTYQFLFGNLLWGQTGSWHVDSGHCTEFGGGSFTCTMPVESISSHDSIEYTPPIGPIVIQVYPNPTFNEIYISSEVPDSNSNVRLTVYDLLGRTIKTVSIPNGKSTTTIFADDWAAGMYLLRFMNGGIEIKTDKVVRVQ